LGKQKVGVLTRREQGVVKALAGETAASCVMLQEGELLLLLLLLPLLLLLAEEDDKRPPPKKAEIVAAPAITVVAMMMMMMMMMISLLKKLFDPLPLSLSTAIHTTSNRQTRQVPTAIPSLSSAKFWRNRRAQTQRQRGVGGVALMNFSVTCYFFTAVFLTFFLPW
jgi:hypothetical protein